MKVDIGIKACGYWIKDPTFLLIDAESWKEILNFQAA